MSTRKSTHLSYPCVFARHRSLYISDLLLRFCQPRGCLSIFLASRLLQLNYLRFELCDQRCLALRSTLCSCKFAACLSVRCTLCMDLLLADGCVLLLCLQ